MATSTPSPDIVIAGGGPSAALLATRLCARGASVTLVAPGGLTGSPHTLCAFADELPPSLTLQRWEECAVVVDGGVTHNLRPYARLDGEVLAASARSFANNRVVDDRVGSVTADGAGVVVDTARSGPLRARALIDCTGAGGLGGPAGAPARCHQTAFGLRIRGADAGVPPGSALFMDWSRDGAHDDVDDNAGVDGPPSFLYALADDDGTLLLEETALAARPAVGIEALRHRLQRRLARRGTRVDAVLAEERVSIPLDLAPPPAGRIFASFGVAAGLVNPTSGFHVGRCFASVDAVADAVVANVGAGAVAVADAVRAALWTPEALAVHDLQLFALEAALRLRDRREAASFFGCFFTDPRTSSAWLAGTLSASEMRAAMLSLFARAPWHLRRRLLGVAGAGGVVRGMWSSWSSPSPSAPPSSSTRASGAAS